MLQPSDCSQGCLHQINQWMCEKAGRLSVTLDGQSCTEIINDMENNGSDKTRTIAKTWIALKRLDLNDGRITALREIHIEMKLNSADVRQIICSSFGLNAAQVILKIRNSYGSLIPLNGRIPANSKHAPYVLEVVKIFQHVVPRPCINATTLINKGMKTRLRSIARRIERLEDLVPQIKLKHHEKVNQEVKLLSQKLVFLNKRMQLADSHCWRGMFVRPPLW